MEALETLKDEFDLPGEPDLSMLVRFSDVFRAPEIDRTAGVEPEMIVALADSFFFDVDPNGARSRVLGFLLISFAPFLLIAAGCYSDGTRTLGRSRRKCSQTLSPPP